MVLIKFLVELESPGIEALSDRFSRVDSAVFFQCIEPRAQRELHMSFRYMPVQPVT